MEDVPFYLNKAEADVCVLIRRLVLLTAEAFMNGILEIPILLSVSLMQHGVILNGVNKQFIT